MDAMTLRQAAARTARSITTLRRYIRRGRLHADLREGRFGPEYWVSPGDLVEAGLEPKPDDGLSRALTPAGSWLTLERLGRDTVPLTVFQELQMKHEQLLVQYGMVRAGGLRLLELQAELETARAQVASAEDTVTRLRRRHHDEMTLLKRRLRESELELEGRRVEVAALREKMRALELLRPLAAPGAADERFGGLVDQIRRVDRLQQEADREAEGRPLRSHPGRSESDH